MTLQQVEPISLVAKTVPEPQQVLYGCSATALFESGRSVEVHIIILMS